MTTDSHRLELERDCCTISCHLSVQQSHASDAFDVYDLDEIIRFCLRSRFCVKYNLRLGFRSLSHRVIRRHRRPCCRTSGPTAGGESVDPDEMGCCGPRLCR